MGATVLLFNRYDQLVQRALTNDQGKFAFDRLTPDLYSIRVSLASFVPALRRNISVVAGSESLLQINLANLFSSVDLISSGPSRGTLMSDDWKWVLRSSQATRPVMRFLPTSTSASSGPSIFSDTTGLVKLSAGDGESFAGGSQEDLGTAFAVATSIFGTSRVQVSGNIGYIGNSAIPTTGFRTRYMGNPDGGGPEVTLTVRQVYLPSRGPDNSEPLRTASLALRDRLDLSEDIHLEYGVSMESVTLLDTVTTASPFARITYDLGTHGTVRVAYASGTPPPEFAIGNANVEGIESNQALNQDLAALALLPRISRRDDRVQVQRTQNLEMGYQIVDGSRTYSVSAYSEAVSNGAFTLSGPSGLVPYTDSLPDLGSNSRIFDVGSFHRMGYTAAAKQQVGPHSDVSFATGYTGALTAGSGAISTGDDLRALIHEVNSPWISVSASSTMPASGTVLVTTYGWTDSHVLMPDHIYLTENVNQSTGWNIRIRQPLPIFSGRGGRLEATAELRNLLAQGYLPIDTAGRKALLTNAPRSIRGGLAFIF